MGSKIIIFLLLAVGLGFFSCSSPKERSQILRINLSSEPPTLDPRKATDVTSNNVLIMLYEGLTRIGADHTPKPALAEKITLSENRTTYTFSLRKSLWSNGDPVTALDFERSWKQILTPSFPAPFAYKLFLIKNGAAVKKGTVPLTELGIRALDVSTLEVTLEHPAPYFLEMLSYPLFFPLHASIDEKNPETSPSNGPFILKQWDHDNEIRVEKNPLYWEASKVTLAGLKLLIVEDATTELYMYENGELDWAGAPLSNLPTEFLPTLKAEGRVITHPSNGTYYYKINTQIPHLHNSKIRKALAYAINRQEIVDHITQADQEIALALVPNMWDWKSQVLFKDDNKKKAQALFKEGIQELGLLSFPKTFLSFNANREHQKIAQAIQQMWKETFDIEIELETFDWRVYLDKLAKENYQIARMGWLADVNDPISFLDPFKYQDGETNGTGWENPHYISLLNASEVEIDLLTRKKLLEQAEELLIDEMPIIPLYFINFTYMKKPYVHNVFLSPLGIIDFKEAFLK